MQAYYHPAALATASRRKPSLSPSSYDTYCLAAPTRDLRSETSYPRRSGPLTLADLPTEILENILSHLCGAPDSTVYITRKAGTSFTPSDLLDGSVRHSWRATGYPLPLLRVNRRIAAIAFDQLFRSTAFVLSVSSTDALCFLKYALSDRQRVALRRIRLPRFMLSWEDRVGSDIWLAAHKSEPAFHRELVWKMPGTERVHNLVTHLQMRHPMIAAEV